MAGRCDLSPNILLQVAHVLGIIVIPVLLVCVIRRTKALMQGRPGPPFFQSVFDLIKRFGKGETISSTASWFFRANPIVGIVIIVGVALFVPWTGAEPIAKGTGAADLILIIYLLAMARFFAILAALDTGSAFGGLGGSREATLAVLIEPSLLLSLTAVSLSSGTMDLSLALESPLRTSVALLSGAAFLVASLAELSRMPVDDSTTHLELTMIHEATILENSGRNLALIEIGVRTAVFFGIGVRLLCGGMNGIWAPGLVQAGLTAGGVLATGVLLGVFEGVAVKLNWRKVPSFVAFSTALAVMAIFVAAMGA